MSRAAALATETARALHWQDGLRETLIAIVTRSVDAAERQLGPKRGAVKRDFVIDVVLRVISRNYLRFPLPLFGEAAVRPVVGVFVDWTVETLNTRKGHRWYPPRAPIVFWIRYRGEDLSGVRRAPMHEVGRLFVIALPALALPFIIRAAVVEGVATATEVSTIGIAYSVLAGLIVYRRFDWRRLKPMLVETACLTGAIIFIVGCATAMAWGLTQSGFSRDLARLMASIPGGAYGFLAVSILAFVILGSVLEGIPAIVLFGPLLFPIARAAGVHEVHYAMVVIFAMGIGLFAPPFGVGYYGACAISKVHPDEGLKYVWGYVAALLVGLAVVAAVPWLSTGFLD